VTVALYAFSIALMLPLVFAGWRVVTAPSLAHPAHLDASS
jgi:hypothetical protein